MDSVAAQIDKLLLRSSNRQQNGGSIDAVAAVNSLFRPFCSSLPTRASGLATNAEPSATNVKSGEADNNKSYMASEGPERDYQDVNDEKAMLNTNQASQLLTMANANEPLQDDSDKIVQIAEAMHNIIGELERQQSKIASEAQEAEQECHSFCTEVADQLAGMQNGLANTMNQLTIRHLDEPASRKSSENAADYSNENDVSQDRDNATLLGAAEEIAAKMNAMTTHIRTLDAAKRNLVNSMNVLKRLQMLVSAFEKLQAALKEKKYKQCAPLVEAAHQLMQHFRSFRNIAQIAVLSRDVAQVERSCREQALSEFYTCSALTESSPRALPFQQQTILHDAAILINALGEEPRNSLISWYCNSRLDEYKHIFTSDEEARSLDNLRRRFSWLSRILERHNEKYFSIFPFHWHVGAQIATQFCILTRNDIEQLLKRDAQTLEAQTFLDALQETITFESQLNKIFTSERSTYLNKERSNSRLSLHSPRTRSSIDLANKGYILPNKSSAKDDAVSSYQYRIPNYERIISGAFESLSSIFIHAQERIYGGLIAKFRSTPNPFATAAPADDGVAPVLSSATELFLNFRQTLTHSARLFDKATLLSLARVYAATMNSYSERVLSYQLEKTDVQMDVAALAMVLNTADYMRNIVDQLIERFDQFLKERTAHDGYQRRSTDIQRNISGPEAVAISSNANTSIAGTSTAARDEQAPTLEPQIENTVNIDVDVTKIFAEEQESYIRVIDNTIRAMITIVAVHIEPSVESMQQIDWSKIDDIRDQSAHASEMTLVFTNDSKLILTRIESARYARSYCERLVDGFVNLFLNLIFRVRPISEVGAEQV